MTEGGQRTSRPKLTTYDHGRTSCLSWASSWAPLGRNRVCALYEDGVEIPSDYAGVAFVPLDAAGAWRLDLAKEMQAAGLPVDLNKAV